MNSKVGGKKARQRGERRQSFARAIGKSEKRSIGRSTTRQTPLDIRVRDLELDADLRDYVARRAGFRLAKYALHVTRITIRFENIGGPKGATECLCKFVIALAGRGMAVVTAADSSARAAFDSAADATERAVRRLLGRHRQSRRALQNGIA